MLNPWIIFKEHQWIIVAVIAVIGFICFTYNTIHKKPDPEQETFKVVSENLTRAGKGAAGRYAKAPDSDIYQKSREEDHVS